MRTTKRMPLYVGKRCNCACEFCYYLSEIYQPHFPYGEIVKQLKRYKRYGIQAVDLTGGEPTIHKDIIRIIRTCIQMGFQDISIITNGIALKKKSYIDELINAGISTFVFSLHGHCAEVHDSLTRKEGSFDTLIKVMQYLNNRDVKFSVNMVVNNRNYQYLAEYARLLSQIQLKGTVTFLVMNPLNDGKLNFTHLAVNYSEAAVRIKEAIDIFNENRITCTWKFMPLCVGRAILEHTNNIYQFFYDPYDWNYPVQFRMEFGYRRYLHALFKNFSRFNHRQLDAIPYKHLIYLALLNESFYTFFIKLEPCRACKYFYVCDGISMNYLDIFGPDEFRPVEGEQIINPVDVVGKSHRPGLGNKLANYTFSCFTKIVCTLLKI